MHPHIPRQAHVWDAVFPWEFPQDASKTEEEQFLSRYFSKHEIHMQGFRFLKQVFYSIALYNLNVRIPAFTGWWLSKPSSVELLNDAKLQPFLLRKDARPSTFFEDELPQYGEKFLTWVIPHLQSTIKQRLEKPETVGKPVPAAIDIAASTKKTQREVSEESDPRTAQSVDSVVNTTVSLPTPVNVQPMSAIEVPQSAPPLMTAMELAPRARVVSNEQPRQSELQPRKRGNSFNRHSRQRGRGNFPIRNERNPKLYPSPGYWPPPVPMRNPRMPSDGPSDWTPLQMPPQLEYPPMQLGHPRPHIQHVPLEARFAPAQPPPYFNQPYEDRPNGQGFAAFEPQMAYFHDPESFPGGHRRDSQGSRGGRPFRGQHSGRGKHSRGKNSFNKHDQLQFAMHGDLGNVKPVGDFPGHAVPQKQRRGSALFERNWRSGSDHPQVQWNEPTMKENRLPTQQLGASEQGQMSFVPQAQSINTIRTSRTPSKYRRMTGGCSHKRSDSILLS